VTGLGEFLSLGNCGLWAIFWKWLFIEKVKINFESNENYFRVQLINHSDV
jgi:hypothetical protein